MSNYNTSEDAVAQASEKVGFALDRLRELLAFCELSRDAEPSTYAEQSHFVIGICGRTLDEAYGILAKMRKGTFDDHPDVQALGIKG